jgi:hypothetical protein
MKYATMAQSLVLLGLTFTAPHARAQGHVGNSFGYSGRSGSAFSHHGPSARGVMLARRGHRFHPNSPFAPNYYPYYDPYFYSYDESNSGTVPAPPPPTVLQPAGAPEQSAPQKPVESLVMELRGDRWVRLTNYGAANLGDSSADAQAATGHAASQSKASVASALTPAPTVLPPAMLVFRDGHQEQAAKYTVVGRTIYLKGDYWTTGWWTRSVPISELNVAATVQLNQERGVKFTLPSRPSEVIVR